MSNTPPTESLTAPEAEEATALIAALRTLTRETNVTGKRSGEINTAIEEWRERVPEVLSHRKSGVEASPEHTQVITAVQEATRLQLIATLRNRKERAVWALHWLHRLHLYRRRHHATWLRRRLPGARLFAGAAV